MVLNDYGRSYTVNNVGQKRERDSNGTITVTGQNLELIVYFSFEKTDK